MKTIAQHAKDVLMEHEVEAVSFGDLDMLGEIYERRFPSRRSVHPLDRNHSVLDALDKSPLFAKSHMHLCDSRGRDRVVRVFTLKPVCEWVDCYQPATHSIIVTGCSGSPSAKVCTEHAQEEIAEGNPFVVPLKEVR